MNDVSPHSGIKKIDRRKRRAAVAAEGSLSSVSHPSVQKKPATLFPPNWKERVKELCKIAGVSFVGFSLVHLVVREYWKRRILNYKDLSISKTISLAEK